MNRRDFLRAAGRGVFLTGMAVSGIILVENKKITTRETCNGKTLCSSCSRINGCKLPLAVKYRDNGKR